MTIGLDKKPIELIKAFGNSFMRSISENLSFEMKKLEPTLLNLIDEKPDDLFVPISSKTWDMNLIRQRANLWGKRIVFLHKVKIFKGYYAKYYKKKFGRKPTHTKDYHSLLNMIPTSFLLGQRPSDWWTRSHDIDLIIGTYKHGYANYSLMKDAEEFSFNIIEKESYFCEFPNADAITRRLKKLIALIVTHERTFKKYDFTSRDTISSDLKEYSNPVLLTS